MCWTGRASNQGQAAGSGNGHVKGKRMSILEPSEFGYQPVGSTPKSARSSGRAASRVDILRQPVGPLADAAAANLGGRASQRIAQMARTAPMHLRLQANWQVRSVLLRLLGLSMVLGSTGLWLMPDAGVDPQMSLIRIGISVAFLFLGLILLTTHSRDPQPEACFDPIRRELRILRKGADGTPRVVMRRSYQSLGGVRLSARSIAVLDADGSTLMELPIDSNETRMRLRDQLSGALQIVS